MHSISSSKPALALRLILTYIMLVATVITAFVVADSHSCHCHCHCCGHWGLYNKWLVFTILYAMILLLNYTSKVVSIIVTEVVVGYNGVANKSTSYCTKVVEYQYL